MRGRGGHYLGFKNKDEGYATRSADMGILYNIYVGVLEVLCFSISGMGGRIALSAS